MPGVLPRHTPPKPPARLGGAAPGVRYASHPDGRNVSGWVAQAEGSRWPTILRGPAATEHIRGDRARSQQTAQGCPAGAPPKAAAALRRGMVRATAGARPAAAVAAVWKEGGACADPRATEAKRPKGAEQARRPAARVGRVGPLGPRGAGGCHQAAGGTPATFRALSCSTAPWRAECSIGSAMAARSPARCAGRAWCGWAKRKEGQPLQAGPLLKWSLSRPLRRCIVIVSQFCAIVNPCCACRCRCCSGCCFGPSRGALPPWGGRGVGLLPCLCRPAVCRRTKKALDSLAGVWYGKAVGSISLNVRNLAKFNILLNSHLAKCGHIGPDEIQVGAFFVPRERGLL